MRRMHRTAARLLLVAALSAFWICAGALPAMALSVTSQQLTSDTFSRENLAASGGRLVYESVRSGNRDIYLFDISSGQESRITSQPADQFFPAIEGDRVAWYDRRNAHPDVYYSDLGLGVETRVTFDNLFPQNTPLERPHIFGNWIYWSNNEPVANSQNVYAFDVPTRTRRTYSSVGADYYPSSSRDYSASLWGSRAMWHADEWYYPYPYLVPAKTHLQRPTPGYVEEWKPNRQGEPFEPIMWGDRVIGRENDATTGNDVALYTVDPVTRVVIAGTANDERPLALYGDYAAWEDRTEGAIYLADLNTSDYKAWRFPSDTVTSTVSITDAGVYWIDSSGDLHSGAIQPGARPVTTTSIDSAWHQGAVTVSFEATCVGSPVATTYFRIDEGPVGVYSEPFQITTQGRSRVRFWSVSQAGAVEPVKDAEVKIDSVLPQIYMRCYTGGTQGQPVHNTDWPVASATAKWHTGWMQVYLKPEDGGTRTHYRINGGDWQVFSGVDPITFDDTTDGSYFIEYWAEDAAGNASAVKSGWVNFDNKAPTTTCDSASGWRTSDFAVTLTATDTRSGVATTYVEWAPEGQGFSNQQVYKGPISFTSEFKTTQMRFWSLDKFGHAEAKQTVWFGLDKTAPVTTSNATAGWNRGNFVMSLNVVENGSGFGATYWRVNDGQINTWPRYYNNYISGEGTNVVEWWTTDVAGNVETTKSATILIDNTAPTVSSNIPDRWPAEPYLVSLTASDTGSGLKRIVYRVQPRNGATGPDTDYTAPFYVTGPAQVTFWAEDYVGNTGGYATLPYNYGIDHGTYSNFGACGSCHNKQMDTEHSNRGFGCGTCHSPNYRRHTPTMCNASGCHPSPIPGFKTYVPGRAQHVACETCHDPIGLSPYLGHNSMECGGCHPGGWAGRKPYAPEDWWFPHSGCERCHGTPTPYTAVQKAMIRRDRLCEGCHTAAPIHPDYQVKHQTTTNMASCTCHKANLTEQHVACETCHAQGPGAVTNAVLARTTACESCHAAGHPHPAAAITGVQAGDGHLCTECHSTDIVVEHSKATSAGSADACATCHADGGARSKITGAWDLSCTTAACHGEASAQPMHSTYCGGCHENENTDFSVKQTNFAAPTVTKTKCLACHGTGITNAGSYKVGRRWVSYRHLSHNATDECAGCHYWEPRRTEFYTHTVKGAYGFFASVDSTNPAPARAHSVHVNGSWAAPLEFAPQIYCGNCHKAAGCGSCHEVATMPAAHANHGTQATQTVLAAPGAASYTAPKAALVPETRSCTAAACHGSAATQVPTCTSCHTDRTAKHW